jgi:hypothetical protein
MDDRFDLIGISSQAVDNGVEVKTGPVPPRTAMNIQNIMLENDVETAIKSNEGP